MSHYQMYIVHSVPYPSYLEGENGCCCLPCHSCNLEPAFEPSPVYVGKQEPNHVQAIFAGHETVLIPAEGDTLPAALHRPT